MRRTPLPIVLCMLVALTGCSVLDGIRSDTPPIAAIVADPTQGHAPLRVQFDASNSADDGTIAEYVWDYGPAEDEASVVGVRDEHVFERSGVYTVQLHVTDESGLAGTAEVIITVENTPPLASCRFSSDSPVVGEWILFDASASFDPDGQVVDFIWDFGDGTSVRGTRVGHAYEEPDVYSVRLTIVDNAGATASIIHSFTVHLGSTGGGCGGRSASLR